MFESTTILIVETIIVTLVGSLFHFTYEWSGKNKFVAVFSAVNESTWEHVKLALSGMFACTLVDVWWLGSNPNYWLARSMSFLVPIVVLPIIFYGYTSFTKHSILAIDILSFAVAAFLATLLFVMILDAPAVGAMGGVISVIVSVIVLSLYLLWTRFPLHHNFLFKDPITGQYGYEKVWRKQKARGRRKIERDSRKMEKDGRRVRQSKTIYPSRSLRRSDRSGRKVRKSGEAGRGIR